MSHANLIGGISAENRLLRPYEQDRPVLVLLCGTPCKYGLSRSWREPVNSERLYKRSRPLLRVGSREATLCLFVAPRQRTALQAGRGRQAAARNLRALRRSMSDDGRIVLEQATMSSISASAGKMSEQDDATMEQQKLAIATLQARLQGTESKVSLLDGKVESGFAKLAKMLSSLALPKHAALGSAIETEVAVEAQRRAEADIAAAAEQRRMRETRQAAL
jgi:hypothetical protein